LIAGFIDRNMPGMSSSDRHPADRFKPGQAAEHVSTRDGYDRWAEIYDQEENPLIAMEEARLPALLGEIAGRDVLELGCGTGRVTTRLVAAGGRITAIDFSSEMVERARRKPGWQAVRFIAHDLAQPLPLTEGSFDLVVSCLVLDHIADLDLFFSQCRRVVRPAGRAVFSVMHPAMMLRGILAHFRDPATGRDICPASAPNQLSDYIMAALRAGWAIEHLSEHGVDDQLADRNPRAAKYRGWPMLLLLALRAPH